LDLEAELFEATDEAIGDLGAMALIEVINTEIVVLDAIAEDVVHGG
jgi:hypothetical protein